jgi:mono/diheme cytochrome c family protein
MEHWSVERWRRWVARGTTVAVLGAALACAGSAADGDARVAYGRTLFRQTCATCHGVDGEGIDRLGKPLIGSQFIATASDGALLAFLGRGRSATHAENTRGVDMPPRGGNPNLSDDDLVAIVAYLRALR